MSSANEPVKEEEVKASATLLGATKSLHVLVQRFILLNPDHDSQGVAHFIALLREINGEPFNMDVELDGSNLGETRSLIRGFMDGFIVTVEKELPKIAQKIVALKYRVLFGIIELPVEIKVIPENADSSPDSGTGSVNSAKEEISKY